ncbi:HNH endonuclease signature motif containing protein [Aeromicrobium sp. Leaf272]|uniref:HNH endonuclease signature motif containing protein n=1 Tax=Aeromicrobium sp. Leaf272 TaxID=1736317 RepID=UPI0009ECABBD
MAVARTREYTARDAQWRTDVFNAAREAGVLACVVCGSTENLQADHIIPYSQWEEGRYMVTNGQIMCSYHNKSKGATVGPTRNAGRRERYFSS